MPASRHRKKGRKGGSHTSDGVSERRRTAQDAMDRALTPSRPRPTWKMAKAAVKASGMTWPQVIWTGLKMKFGRKKEQ